MFHARVGLSSFYMNSSKRKSLLTLTPPVLDPISTKGLTSADVDELTRSTRELMLKELIALTERARGQKITSAPRTVSHTNGVIKASGSDMRVAA